VKVDGRHDPIAKLLIDDGLQASVQSHFANHSTEGFFQAEKSTCSSSANAPVPTFTAFDASIVASCIL
jgi:hypothetical protein